jgi:hypothetical protein
MDIKKRIWLPITAAVALACATCAPVPNGTPQGGGSGQLNAEPLPEALKTAPTIAGRGSGPRARIDAAIQNVRERDMRTDSGFWTVFHGIVGLGPTVTLLNEDTKERVNAVEYIASGAPVRGMLFVPTQWGVDVKSTEMFVGQGHQDQFIAEMAQWGIPLDKKFKVEGREYEYKHFVRHTQMRARITENQELSWAVLVLGQYLGTDAKWPNGSGEKLSVEDIVRYELDAPMDAAACGGTHRLFDLAWVYHLHLIEGGKRDGVWKAVDENTAKYVEIARKYQNPDGSFSTNFFRGPGNAGTPELRINTTGHTLEWLSLVLSDAELKQQWVENAANALALMILEQERAPVEGGSLYHATHGLLLYHARVYGREGLGANTPLYPLPPDWSRNGPSWKEELQAAGYRFRPSSAH